MIEDLYITGRYIDDAMTIEAALVNPSSHGIDESLVVFKLDIRGVASVDLNKLTFYIEGKGHRLYNAETVTRMETTASATDDNRITTMLVAYEFRPEYLYRMPRLAFLYEAYDSAAFIGLGI